MSAAALSFLKEDSELRVSELLEDETIIISLGDNDDELRYVSAKMDIGDLKLLKKWVEEQISKTEEPKSNG